MIVDYFAPFLLKNQP